MSDTSDPESTNSLEDNGLLDPLSIAQRLALYSQEKNIPLKFIKILNGKIVNTSNAMKGDDILTFYRLYKYSISDTIMIYYWKNKQKSVEDLSSQIILFLKTINETEKVTDYLSSVMPTVIRKFTNRWESLLELTKKRLEKLQNIKNFFDEIELKEEVKESLRNSFSEDNVVKSYNYEYKKFELTQENANYVFNEFRTDENLIYIEYIDENNKSMIKIHDTIDKELNLDIEDRNTNMLYFKYKHQADIIDIKLNIVSNRLQYSYYPGKDDSEMDIIIKTLFNEFDLTDQKTLFTSGSFTIDIKNFKEYNFYYFIFIAIKLLKDENDLENIIYMRETFNPRSLKKRTKYYFRDFENINHIEYIMSFTIDNMLSNQYIIKYRAKNKEKNFILEIAYLIKKYMSYYEDNCTVNEGEYLADYFVNKFYGEKFDYQERSYSRIPTKIANLRNKSKIDNLFPSGGEYTKGMCECKLQPIIIDKEDVKDWEDYQDTDSKKRTVKHKTLLFPPEGSSQGPKQYYVCPTHRYPFPVLKPNLSSTSKKYPYLPCCKMLEDKDDYSKIYETVRLEGKGPIVSIKYSDLQQKPLPLPLQTFFKTLTDNEIEIKPVKVEVNDSFIGCLMEATKNYEPPKPDKIYKNLYHNHEELKKYKLKYTEKDILRNFRQNINTFKINYVTLKQEMFDYSTEDIIDLLTGEEYIDSMLFFRFFEYMFNVNIFVFTISDNQPILEKPRYKDFHIRNIIEELPAVFIYRDPINIKGRYSLIGGKETLFSSKNFQEFIQPYYKTDINGGNVITYANPYQNIVWEKIFKMFKILSQKINEDGKCYRIDIQIEKYAVSVYVPPSAPLNVIESKKVYRSSTRVVKKYFPQGEIGSQGIWIKINGLRSVFVPCNDLKDSSDICIYYLKDKLESKQSNEYDIYLNHSKNSRILIEIFIWLWRVSRLDLDLWFENYVTNQLEQEDIKLFDDKNLKTDYILPKYVSMYECIKWLRELNPEFSNVFKEDKINIYSDLRQNLFLYMKKIDSLTDGLDNQPIKFLTSILDNKDDYKLGRNEMIFDNIDSFKNWRDNKFHNIEIFDKLIDGGIYLYQNDKGMYLIVNTSCIEEALLITLYWNRDKKIVDKNLFTSQLLTGVIKKVGYKLYDTKLNIVKEVKKEKNLDIVFYNTSLYSTFIKII